MDVDNFGKAELATLRVVNRAVVDWFAEMPILSNREVERLRVSVRAAMDTTGPFTRRSCRVIDVNFTNPKVDLSAYFTRRSGDRFAIDCMANRREVKVKIRKITRARGARTKRKT